MADPLVKKFAPRYRSYESFLGGYLDKGNVQQSRKSIDSLLALKKEMKAAGIKKNPEGKGFYKEKKKYIKECEKRYEVIKARDAIKGITSKIDGAKRWAESAMQRKDVKGVNQYREQIQKELMASQAKLMESLAGQQYFQEMMTYVNGMEQQMAVMQFKAEGDKIARSLHSALGWVGTHLGRKASDDAYKAWMEAKRVAEPLFANQMLLQVDTVQKEMPKYYEYEQMIEGAVQNQKLDKAVEQKARDIRSQARWLTDSLNRKQPYDSIKKHQTLIPVIDAFAQEFGQHPEGQKLLNEVMQIFNRVETEVQPMIDQENAKRAADKMNRAVHWLQSGLQRKVVDEIAKYQAEIIQVMGELQRFSQLPIAQKAYADGEAMLARIENEMGDIIAEKEIARMSQPITSTMNWLQSAFKNKDIRQTQSFAAKLEEQCDPLERYSKHPKAAELLNKARAMHQEMEQSMGSLIAEEEIRSLISKVSLPLSLLESHLKSKDVPQVLKNREKVQQKLIPLRSKYPTHPLALPTIQKGDAVLARIESEIGTIIAEQEVGKVERRIRTSLSFAESAVKNKDAKMGLKSLQECNRLLLPIEAQFGQFAKTMELRRGVDDATQRLGPMMQGVMDSKGAQKSLHEVDEALRKIEGAVAHGDQVMAAKVLKGANAAAVPLRRSYAVLPEVQAALRRLDGFNMQILGGIPPQEDLAPIFDINWKLPEEEQNLLKMIRESFEGFNKKVRDAQTRFDELVSIDGSSRTSVSPSWFVENLVQSDRHHTHPAMEDLENANGFAQKLQAIHPSTSSEPNLVLNQVMEALPQLEAMVKEKAHFWSTRTTYAIAMGNAVVKLQVAQEQIQRAESHGLKDTTPEEYSEGLQRLNAAFSSAAKAKQVLPDDCDEALALMDQIGGYKSATDVAAVSVARQLFERDARNGEWFYADRHEKFLLEKYPNAPENKEVASLKQQIHSEQAARKAELAAEAERKRKAEEEAIEIQRQGFREKYLFPYSGGSVKVGSATWTFSRTEKGGALTNGGVMYEVEATSSSIEFCGKKANHGWGAFNGRKWHFGTSAPRFTITYYSFEWNEEGSAFESSNDGIWRISKNEARATGGDYKVDSVSVSGSVPPYLVLLAAVIDNVIAGIKPWRKVRKQYDELYKKEDDRRQNVWVNVPSSCKICNVGGSNITTCFACGTTFCRSCAGKDNCDCGAFYDNYPHVSSDWEMKTQQELGIW